MQLEVMNINLFNIILQVMLCPTAIHKYNHNYCDVNIVHINQP